MSLGTQRHREEALISGWAVAGEGMAKISKSKGGGPMSPDEMIQRYSADGLRYWAASTSPGRDAVISEEKIQMGMKLATKLWNMARFAEPFIRQGEQNDASPLCLTPADLWIRARCRTLCARVTTAFDAREYASAKTEIESFFWRDLADNYLEMIKQRLYREGGPDPAAAATLRIVFRTVLQLLAPLLPFVTEAIWLELFAGESKASIHRSAWPDPDSLLPSAGGGLPGANDDEDFGEILIAIASAVRRYKSEHALRLGSSLGLLALATADPALARRISASQEDIIGITRAQEFLVGPSLPEDGIELMIERDDLRVAIKV